MDAPIDAARALLRAHLARLMAPDPAAWRAAPGAFFAPEARVAIVHPFEAATGGAGVREVLVEPLLAAFDGLHLRPYLLMAGRSEGAAWAAATGYMGGHFRAPLCGIRPTEALAFLRWGAFHRIEDGRAAESYVFLDLPELMIAAGVWPLARPPGYAGFLPGPVPGDGLDRPPPDPAESAFSCDHVTAMLRKLATPDEAWRPYWHPEMLWYGPAAFGSYIGIDRFAAFQVPFEGCFEGWAGGAAGTGRTRHFTRFGDGVFTCSGGWPSLSGVSVKPWLGQAPTGKMTYMRVCDFWRREGRLLTENWVFVDIPHALLQFGRDVLAEAGG